MSNFSDWTTNVFANGTTPAINYVNLNKNENALAKIMPELNYSNNMNFKRVLEYGALRSQKLIESFEDLSSFTTATSEGTPTFTQDYSSNVYGKSGIRLTEDNNTTGSIYMYKTLGTALDLSVSDSGDAMASNDYIMVAFYLDDVTKVNSIFMRMGDDTSNYFYFVSTTGLISGWNVKSFRKDLWNSTGTPTSDWSNIGYYRFGIETTASAQNTYCIFSKCWTARRQATYSSSNPFYYNDGEGNFDEEPYIVSAMESVIITDNKLMKRGWMLGNSTTYPTMNEVFCTVNSFVLQAEIYCKYAGYGGCVIWYQDVNNYLMFGLYGNDFYIYENDAGSGAIQVYTTVSSVARDTRMILDVEKQGDVCRASLTIDGQGTYYLDYLTGITTGTAGCVGFTKFTENDYGFITDFVVAHNRAMLPSTFNKNISIFVPKLQDETVSNSTTLQDDNELILNLPPNKLFKIHCRIIALASDDNPDINVAFTVDNSYRYFSGRYALGSSQAVTNVLASDARFGYWSAVTFGAGFGIDGTANESVITEEFYLYTGNSGNVVTLQWAQKILDATYPVTVSAGSYIMGIEIG